ncbi:hypothetical protein FRC01_002480 [Tulasnella sp. 417]|nr:hypothetical protein FRC01_002480 [Tulasnella sp. 417]
MIDALQPAFTSWNDERYNRSHSYKVCLDVFRHAYELESRGFPLLFDKMETLVQAIERDIRDPATPSPSRDQLREHRDEWVELVSRGLEIQEAG